MHNLFFPKSCLLVCDRAQNMPIFGRRCSTPLFKVYLVWYNYTITIEVGYRGFFGGHSFRSSWTLDKLVTWYLLIPFSKKKLKKVRKPGCPLRKMEESKMAAAMCQNWHFQPCWHFFEYFSLVKTCYFMFLMPRNPFLKDLLIFDFSFLRKGQFCSKFKHWGHFSMISRILKLTCC